uniref:Uncharacterized protein n=1 Tax=Talaromyces marneffei PM1 TaxID=1077442 RepID=A0A093VB20_TALMA
MPYMYVCIVVSITHAD